MQLVVVVVVVRGWQTVRVRLLGGLVSGFGNVFWAVVAGQGGCDVDVGLGRSGVPRSGAVAKCVAVGWGFREDDLGEYLPASTEKLIIRWYSFRCLFSSFWHFGGNQLGRVRDKTFSFSLLIGSGSIITLLFRTG